MAISKLAIRQTNILQFNKLISVALLMTNDAQFTRRIMPKYYPYHRQRYRIKITRVDCSKCAFNDSSSSSRSFDIISFTCFCYTALLLRLDRPQLIRELPTQSCVYAQWNIIRCYLVGRPTGFFSCRCSYTQSSVPGNVFDRYLVLAHGASIRNVENTSII